MPRATDELRQEWGTSPDKAIAFLQAQGYTQISRWRWRMPARLQLLVTEEEARAVAYLQQEWDFGAVWRDFPLVEVIQAVTALRISTLGGIYRLPEYLAGRSVMTCELPDVFKRASEALCNELPWLVPVRAALPPMLDMYMACFNITAKEAVAKIDKQLFDHLRRQHGDSFLLPYGALK